MLQSTSDPNVTLGWMLRKIVIIEDERDISEPLSYTLTNEGYRFWSEWAGGEGVSSFAKKRRISFYCRAP